MSQVIKKCQCEEMSDEQKYGLLNDVIEEYEKKEKNTHPRNEVLNKYE